MRTITLAALFLLSACSESDLPKTDSKKLGIGAPEITSASSATTAPTSLKSTQSLEQRFNLLGYAFPLSVATVIKDMGKPNRTFVDPSEGCPVGQVHSWDVKEGNYTFQVLGDSYGAPIDYKSGSRIIGLVRIDNSKPSKINGLLDIQLGDEVTEVKRKLDSFVSTNNIFLLSKIDETSPVFQYFGADKHFKYLYLIERDGESAFFLINDSGRVEAIILAAFNLLLAC
ncbi:MAG: hypothetical protein ABL906_00110 [Sideroxydans sp.]